MEPSTELPRDTEWVDSESGMLTRADFLKALALLAGGTAVLPLVGTGCAGDEDQPTEGDALHTEATTYPGKTGEMCAHLARPDGDDRLPAVVVIHENRGLNAHIQDVAERLASEGFLALAPDALSPMGGTPDDEDEARSMIGDLDGEDTAEDFEAAIQYLKTHPQSTGKVGCVGFCWGGAMTNQMAVRSPDLAAAVPYYGRQPDAADVPRIRAALMLHYGGLDERINAGIEAFEAALKEAGVDYQMFVYEGAQHAFNNDTNPGRYHPEAAALAWQRTIGFFREKLGT